MLHVLLAACATLIFALILADPHARLRPITGALRLLQAQEEWAEMMDRHEKGKSDVTDIARLRGEGALGTCA